LTVGFVPQQSTTELARLWIPILNRLQEGIPFKLRFATAPDIPTFEKRMAQGLYDFAYMNPQHYAVFSKRPGYAAFVREKGRKLRGIVVVQRDSPIKSLQDLAGREVAFPAPNSFAATLLVRGELARLGVDVKPRFVNSHESVYLNVTRGVMSAGGGVQGTLQSSPADVRAQLRVLWQSSPFNPHPFAAHPRVPLDDVAALRAAFLSLESDPMAQAALGDLAFKGFEPGADADWNDVRGLKLGDLSVVKP
jgi:phosphonate transport system substrate-binding protein